jgi:hypothetical protein
MAGDDKIILLFTKSNYPSGKSEGRDLLHCPRSLFNSHPTILSVYPSSTVQIAHPSLPDQIPLPPTTIECGGFTSSCLDRGEDLRAYGSSCPAKSHTDTISHSSTFSPSLPFPSYPSQFSPAHHHDSLPPFFSSNFLGSLSSLLHQLPMQLHVLLCFFAPSHFLPPIVQFS